jgi:glycolate oxidase iron-sulfur subunit
VPTPSVVEHLDRCLDCRACETACPSTVKYGEILEKTRTLLQPARRLSPAARFVRWLSLHVVLTSRRAQAVLFKLVWLAQVLGSCASAPRSRGAGSCRSASPPRPHSPCVCRSVRSARASGQRPSPRAARGACASALFTGLRRRSPLRGRQRGDGARAHRERSATSTSSRASAAAAPFTSTTARATTPRSSRARTSRAFEAGGYDAIVSNAAGCGAELRHYGALLDGDAAAVRFGARVRDVAEAARRARHQAAASFV